MSRAAVAREPLVAYGVGSALRTEIERLAPGGRVIAEAAARAHEAAAATADLAAHKGRARVLGEKSKGTPDPGAVSFARLATRLGELLV